MQDLTLVTCGQVDFSNRDIFLCFILNLRKENMNELYSKGRGRPFPGSGLALLHLVRYSLAEYILVKKIRFLPSCGNSTPDLFVR